MTRLLEQAVAADAPPERAFAGDFDRIGRDLQPGDAEAIEMRQPSRFIWQALDRVRRELIDHRTGEVVVTHVGERGLVDDVVQVAGTQDLQEVPPALGEAGGEEGKAIVPDLGRHAVLRSMASPGVIDGEPARARQAGAQHRLGLGDQGGALGGQEPHHLALGDRHAEAGKERRDPLGRDLALVMLQQHEAAQFRPKVAFDTGRQRRHQRPAVGRQPALAAVADDPRLQPQILDHEVLVALEPRAGRRGDRQHPLFADHALGGRAALRTLGLGARPSFRRRPLHPRRLDLGPALVPLEPGDLFTQRRVLFPQPDHLAEQLGHQPPQLLRRASRDVDVSEQQHASL